MEVRNLRTGQRRNATPAAPKWIRRLELRPPGVPWRESEDVAVSQQATGTTVDFAPQRRHPATFWQSGPQPTPLPFAWGLVVSYL